MTQYEHYQITTDSSEECIPHIIDISVCSTYGAEDCNCDDDDNIYRFHIVILLFYVEQYVVSNVSHFQSHRGIVQLHLV